MNRVLRIIIAATGFLIIVAATFFLAARSAESNVLFYISIGAGLAAIGMFIVFMNNVFKVKESAPAKDAEVEQQEEPPANEQEEQEEEKEEK